MPPQVRFAGRTHVGLKRGHNEDSFCLEEQERLAVVADGMGGHASGEVASRLAVDTLRGYLAEVAGERLITWPYKIDDPLRFDVNRLTTAIKLANVKIWSAGRRNDGQLGMGTTLVAALFLDSRVLIGHVGDSRVYRLRDGKLEQLTEDHSLVNDYLKMHILQPDEVDDFPQKNVIVRALGMKDSVQVDLLVETTQAGDLYLLCSDGLSGMIADDQLQNLLVAERDLERACERLIEVANNNGGLDNITAVLARVEA